MAVCLRHLDCPRSVAVCLRHLDCPRSVVVCLRHFCVPLFCSGGGPALTTKSPVVLAVSVPEFSTHRRREQLNSDEQDN
jgi:hypothetical protein